MTWLSAVNAARGSGFKLRLTPEGAVKCSPAPTGELLAALQCHRDRITEFLHDEAEAVRPRSPQVGWRWMGDSWWEDPDTGHFHWCGDAGMPVAAAL